MPSRKDEKPGENSRLAKAGGKVKPRAFGKRLMDVTLIVLALPFLIPVMFLVASVIWVVSGGPIFFRQERVGYLGRKFLCFKFRTMVLGNHTPSQQAHLGRLMDSQLPMRKQETMRDPRIIPFGFHLRSSGLDELPQILNVLRGEMSLVGPRPCCHWEYEKHQPWQKERYNVVPGITGLWQVSGKNNTTFGEMVELDIAYARKQSLWFDFQILLKTIPAVCTEVLQARAGDKDQAQGGRRTALARQTGQQPTVQSFEIT